MLAIALADTNPLVWGGSVLAARAARRVAESMRRASGRTALAGDVEHLLPVLEAARPARRLRRPVRRRTALRADLRPMLLVLDDGAEDPVVREQRGRLQAAAEARGVRVETVGTDAATEVARYASLLLSGTYAAAYLGMAAGRGVDPVPGPRTAPGGYVLSVVRDPWLDNAKMAPGDPRGPGPRVRPAPGGRSGRSATSATPYRLRSCSSPATSRARSPTRRPGCAQPGPDARGAVPDLRVPARTVPGPRRRGADLPAACSRTRTGRCGTWPALSSGAPMTPAFKRLTRWSDGRRWSSRPRPPGSGRRHRRSPGPGRSGRCSSSACSDAGAGGAALRPGPPPHRGARPDRGLRCPATLAADTWASTEWLYTAPATTNSHASRLAGAAHPGGGDRRGCHRGRGRSSPCSRAPAAGSHGWAPSRSSSTCSRLRRAGGRVRRGTRRRSPSGALSLRPSRARWPSRSPCSWPGARWCSRRLHLVDPFGLAQPRPQGRRRDGRPGGRRRRPALRRGCPRDLLGHGLARQQAHAVSAGLFGLLDDIAALARLAAASVDDVGAAAGRASAKAAGVVVDDTAVTPQYVQASPAEARAADHQEDRPRLAAQQAGLHPPCSPAAAASSSLAASRRC